MHNLKDLIILKKAMEVVTEVYRIVANFPSDEKYGLISQIKRSAVSIPSNIAEGAGRESQKEFKYFLSVSNGSCYELQIQLELSFNLGLLREDMKNDVLKKLDELQKMNYSLQKRLSGNSSLAEPEELYSLTTNS